jgi:precorrin-2 dehydrogenase/sirohydrochlorin ferrochelatase
MDDKYTKICPGGGLILAWQLKGKKVLLVGGGNVAAGERCQPISTDEIGE